LEQQQHLDVGLKKIAEAVEVADEMNCF